MASNRASRIGCADCVDFDAARMSFLSGVNWLELPPQAGQPFAAQADHLAVDEHFENVVQFLKGNDLHHGAARQPQFAPMSEPSRIVVLHLADDDGMPIA